ncbi:DUF4232 domain-containing protein [Streptomyces sp. HUAS TT20]|uniref:DUF4232 domain-containing protein n=1 Tax=Streptomyces sp. HUAS TT20 TaxID=3447509 RepID=UPI0021DA43CF|nr:DUF4232 domain-containing protein [Streptomyces sp. HUAS 15-9]UXY27425.1 DUF4232 domain-containing protein [Streptomyces sp. HUAS 15-9]
MFLHTRLFSRRGLTAALTAAAAALATAGVAESATATTTTTAQTSAGTRICAVKDLYLSMGRGEGAAGSLYQPIRFTNTSTSKCALRGYPGVSVLDTAHKQIGPAATRSGSPYGTVTLAPGHSASAIIRTTNGPVGGPCLRTGTYLRIYPPGSYTSTLVPTHWTTCSHLFQVGPINTEGTI